MAIVDFILNLACLLLWMGWRSFDYDPLTKRTPATLLGTLRRAAPSRWRRWHLLTIIAGLLFLRAIFYWQIGSAAGWVGKVDLGLISLSFRSDWFDYILLFSCLSFGMMLGVFYLWLLFFSLLAGRNDQPTHGLVRMQLGAMDAWPRWAKLLAPLLVTGVLWFALSWWLAWLGIIPKPVSVAHRLETALLIGLGSYLAWKFTAALVLVLYLLNTYIYFGKNPLWNYVKLMAQNFLSPLENLPVRVGKVDFAPLIGIVLVFLIAAGMNFALLWLYARLPF